MTNVVLVDKKDNEIGFKEKLEAHKVPVSLHRAISIVIFNADKTKMLITKRAISKKTWPHFWSNTVCSHPLPKESCQNAADRRIFEELGFKTPLTEMLSFVYNAKMASGIWGEHELDHVFTGIYSGVITPNPQEVEGYEWIKIDDLKKDLFNNSSKYTPWFKIIIEKLKL